MIPKEILKEVVGQQKKKNILKKNLIERDVRNEIDLANDLILVLTGIRRSGKSTLLKQVLADQKKTYLFLNFEDPKLSGFEFNDFQRLDLIYEEDNYSLLGLDEIQDISNWEKYIRNCQDNGYKVILTGSNASLLNSDLGTKLTGRYTKKDLFPFSYNEFCNFKKLEISEKSLLSYLEKGGFPEFLKTNDDEVLFHLFDDIIYRDIAVKYGIRQHHTLRNIAIFLISNAGKRYSLNNIRKIFNVGSPKSVADYVSLFEDCYLLFSLSKFSYSLKKQIVNPRKIYAIDVGLAGINSLSLSKDLGRKLENLIFIFLKKKFKQLYYFSETNECDFIVVHRGEPYKAVQVCFELNQDNIDRELNGVVEALKHLNIKEGEIITLNQEDLFEKEGFQIKVIPAYKYLNS